MINFHARDFLEDRATETLRQIARYDICDLSGHFEGETFSHCEELTNIRKEVESLDADWAEFCEMGVLKVEN